MRTELGRKLFGFSTQVKANATPVIAYAGLAHSAEVSIPDNAEL